MKLSLYDSIDRKNEPISRKYFTPLSPTLCHKYELKYLDFPLPFSVNSQNLPSLFSGKCHALLCRGYTKGRDWYDFLWYVARETSINFTLLTCAIDQTGPWQNQKIIVTSDWLSKTLKQKIRNTDWETAKKDVARFLTPNTLKTLELWQEDFFISRVEKLSGYLK